MIRQYVQQLIADAGIVEVRHLPTRRSGTFDDAGRLVEAVRRYRGFGNLYCTLNEPAVEALNDFGASALRDADIVRIKRLPFDFDPVRPTGAASTPAQVFAARQAAIRLANDLCKLGFPQPLIARSGNGCHLQYRVNVRASPEVAEVMAEVYRGLQRDYSTAEVLFDPTVRNPSRILRLYGTVNRKGGQERPTKCWMPEPWEAVDFSVVEALANRYVRRREAAPKPPLRRVGGSGRGDYNSVDVVAWFQSRGLYEEPLDGGKHAVVCPWEKEHSSSSPRDTIIYEADGGWPGFHCKHAHCSGRKVRDVMALWGDADEYCSLRAGLPESA